MASVKKRGQSYLITVSCGYKDGKKLPPETMTWKPDPGLTDKQILKELDKAKHEFERQVKTGKILEGSKITLEKFCKRWMKDYAQQQLKLKTQIEYQSMLDLRILPALGHYKLSELQPPVLIKFINALQEPGTNQCMTYKPLQAAWEALKASGKKLADFGIDHKVMHSLIAGGNCMMKTAEKFAKAVMDKSATDFPSPEAYEKAVQKKIRELFKPAGPLKSLTANTVQHYLRCLSTILSTAVVWQVIESNPCQRVKPPKVVRKKIKYLEVDQAQDLTNAALSLDDMRIQTAVLVFLFTGIRKGELCGLQWKDVNLNTGTITVERAVQSIPKHGLVVSDTKTESGERFFSISDDLIQHLRKYRLYYNTMRVKAGDLWQGKDRKVFIESEKQREVECIRKGETYVAKNFEPVEWMFTNWQGYNLHPSTVYHWVKPFLVANEHPEMTVHGLRHSNLSLLLSQGVDLITVSRRAGHAKPSTTADLYAHALRKPDEAAAEKLNTLLRPSSRTASQ